MKEGTKHHENTQCIVLQIVWQNANSNVKCEHHEHHSTNEGGMEVWRKVSCEYLWWKIPLNFVDLSKAIRVGDGLLTADKHRSTTI